jgi:hypothetical protein
MGLGSGAGSRHILPRGKPMSNLKPIDTLLVAPDPEDGRRCAASRRRDRPDRDQRGRGALTLFLNGREIVTMMTV